MTTQAKLADGTVLNFPDGTPQEVIQGVVKQHMAGTTPGVAPAPSFSDQALRQLGLTGRAAVSGLMSIPNAIGDAANQTINYGIQGLNAALKPAPTMSQLVTGEKPQGPIPYLGLPSKATQDLLTQAGVPTPDTPLEKGVNIAGQMMSSGPSVTGAAKLLDAAGIKGMEGVIDQGWSGLQGLFKSGAPKAGAVEVPTTAQIKAASQAAYKASEDAGLVLGPQPLQRVLADSQAKLAELGYRPTLQPKIATALAELTSDADRGNITLKGVDGLRQVMLGITRDGNPSERMMAGKIIERLDDSMTNLTADDVVMGNADEGLSALSQARGRWKTQAKSDLLDRLMTKAQDQAGSTNSGGNLQNVMRQKLRSILDSPKQSRLFSQDELDAMRQIVRGTAGQNALRTVGRLAPSSNSWLGPMMAMMGGGSAAATGGDMLATAAGAAVPAIGAVAKAAATRSTAADIKALSNMVRASAVPKPAAVPLTPPDLPSIYARLLSQGTAGTASPYARALLQQFGGGALPAIAGPGTAPQGRP